MVSWACESSFLIVMIFKRVQGHLFNNVQTYICDVIWSPIISVITHCIEEIQSDFDKLLYRVTIKVPSPTCMLSSHFMFILSVCNHLFFEECSARH